MINESQVNNDSGLFNKSTSKIVPDFQKTLPRGQLWKLPTEEAHSSNYQPNFNSIKPRINHLCIPFDRTEGRKNSKNMEKYSALNIYK